MPDDDGKGSGELFDFYTWLSSWFFAEKAQVIISGALGGVVRWLTLRERFPAGLVSITVGGICALYLGPLVDPMISPFVKVVLEEPVSRSAFSGFLVGLGGISVTGFIIDIFRIKRRELGGDSK